MRQYFNQRVTRFETDYDLNFFREQEGEDCHHNCHHHHHHHRVYRPSVEVVPHLTGGIPRGVEVQRVEQTERTLNHSIYQNLTVNNGHSSQHLQRVANVQVSSEMPNRRKTSVTNLMFMRVVDGNLITSIWVWVVLARPRDHSKKKQARSGDRLDCVVCRLICSRHS